MSSWFPCVFNYIPKLFSSSELLLHAFRAALPICLHFFALKTIELTPKYTHYSIFSELGPAQNISDIAVYQVPRKSSRVPFRVHLP